MPFVPINPTNPNEKILTIGGFENLSSFESANLIFFSTKYFFLLHSQVKVYWLARMGQNFDQAKYFEGDVHTSENLLIIILCNQLYKKRLCTLDCDTVL